MPYIDYTDVETFLDINLSADGQTAVNAIIPAVEAYAESYCRRKWNRGSDPVTETFDATSDVFFPQHSPVDSITEITVNGATIDPASVYNYGSYIRLFPRLFPFFAWTYSPYRSVTITYTANVPLPADLKHALVRWTADIFKSSEDAGKAVSRAKTGEVEVWFTAQDGIPKYVEMVFDRYRLPNVWPI